MFEILIKEALEAFFQANNIIPEVQFGFRQKLSTVHAIQKLTSDIQYALHNKQSVAACLMDLKTAFDTVWIKGLLYKLKKKQCPLHLIKIIANMLRDTKLYTTDGKIESDCTLQLTDGLQQGTVTAKDLFNFYNADIPNLFGIPESNDTNIILFADDLIFYVKGKNVKKLQAKVQTTYNKITDCYQTWKLRANPTKCETILFRKIVQMQGATFKTTYKTFAIKDNNVEIPHKSLVK